QKMTRKKIPRLRVTSQASEPKKSRLLSKKSFTLISQQELPDHVAGGEGEPDDRQHHGCHESEHAEPLTELRHRTLSSSGGGARHYSPERSARRESEPV